MPVSSLVFYRPHGQSRTQEEEGEKGGGAQRFLRENTWEGREGTEAGRAVGPQRRRTVVKIREKEGVCRLRKLPQR